MDWVKVTKISVKIVMYCTLSWSLAVSLWLSLSLNCMHLCFPDYLRKISSKQIVSFLSSKESNVKKHPTASQIHEKKTSAVLSKSVIIGLLGHSHAHLVCRRRNLTKLHWNAIIFRKLQNCKLNASFSFAQKHGNIENIFCFVWSRFSPH